MRRHDVLVIGAGAAGLACAASLTECGLDAVVLEARDRLGGRILTHRSPSGAMAELGAQVVHPTADTALTELVERVGLAAAPLDRQGEVVVVSDRTRLTSAAVAASHAPPPWVVEQTISGPGNVVEQLAGLPEPARGLARLWLEQSVGGDGAELSAGGVAALRTVRGAGGEKVLVDGFDSVLPLLADGLDVRAGFPVEVLEWSAGAVCARGTSTVRALAAVVTVPPSVVAAGGLRFDPALPREKVAVLPSLASGDAITVAVTTRRPSARTTWALFAEPPWGLWHTSAGSPVVTGHIKGPRAAEVRSVNWSLADVGWVTGALDEALGTALEVVVHDWGADEWSCGAYSLPLLGADASAARWAQDLAGTVFFAGEATADLAGRALVQGALSSGRRAADEVARALGHD